MGERLIARRRSMISIDRPQQLLADQEMELEGKAAWLADLFETLR
jgi:hypothetical protein